MYMSSRLLEQPAASLIGFQFLDAPLLAFSRCLFLFFGDFNIYSRDYFYLLDVEER